MSLLQRHARDLILLEFVGVLKAFPELADRVYRAADQVYAAPAGPAASVTWSGEQLVGADRVPVQTRELAVEVTLRARKAVDLDAELNALAATVEAAITARAWVVLIKRCYLEGTVPVLDELQQPVGAVTQTWQVMYRVDMRAPEDPVA